MWKSLFSPGQHMQRSLFSQGYCVESVCLILQPHINPRRHIEYYYILGVGSFSETIQAWILRCIFYQEYFKVYTTQRILGNFPLGFWIWTHKLYVFCNLCEAEDIFASVHDVSSFHLDSSKESLSWLFGSKSCWQQVCLQTRSPDLQCG